MNITPAVIALIKKRFRDAKLPKLTQAEFGRRLGYGRPWGSKFFKGDIKSLDDDMVPVVEEYLGIRLRPHFVDVEPEAVPDLAIQLGKRMKRSRLLSQIVSGLMEVAEFEREPGADTGLPWVPTSDMTRVGQEIIKMAFANEDKPGKVARMTIELLSRGK